MSEIFLKYETELSYSCFVLAQNFNNGYRKRGYCARFSQTLIKPAGLYNDTSHPTHLITLPHLLTKEKRIDQYLKSKLADHKNYPVT